MFHIQNRKKSIRTPLTGLTFGETSPANQNVTEGFRILQSRMHAVVLDYKVRTAPDPLFGSFSLRMPWKKNKSKIHNIKKSNIRQINS